MTEYSEKAAYVTPTLVELGTFEQLTQGTDSGLHLDAAIPVGTPVTSIGGFVATHVS